MLTELQIYNFKINLYVKLHGTMIDDQIRGASGNYFVFIIISSNSSKEMRTNTTHSLVYFSDLNYYTGCFF